MNRRTLIARALGMLGVGAAAKAGVTPGSEAGVYRYPNGSEINLGPPQETETYAYSPVTFSNEWGGYYTCYPDHERFMAEWRDRQRRFARDLLQPAPEVGHDAS